MLDVVVLFFLLGVLAKVLKSDLRLPDALYETLSIYLLLAIGLKGGIEMSKQSLMALMPQVAACLALGFAIPFMLVPVLRRLGLNAVDSAALAAHYGSVSVVTFAVATAYLQKRSVPLESHAALWVALMEAPGLVAGIWLARRGGAGQSKINWQELAHDVFLGKSVLLLVGGLTIGALMGEAGTAPIKNVFVDPFKGVLALFLLELGLVAGARLGELRKYGFRLVGFALLAPLVLSVAGGLGRCDTGPECGRCDGAGQLGGQCQLYRSTHGDAHCGAPGQCGLVHHGRSWRDVSVQYRDRYPALLPIGITDRMRNTR